jgi:hypothetical protein
MNSQHVSCGACGGLAHCAFFLFAALHTLRSLVLFVCTHFLAYESAGRGCNNSFRSCCIKELLHPLPACFYTRTPRKSFLAAGAFSCMREFSCPAGLTCFSAPRLLLCAGVRNAGSARTRTHNLHMFNLGLPLCRATLFYHP